MLDQIQKGWKAEMGKLEELISATKLNDFLKKNEEQEKKKMCIRDRYITSKFGQRSPLRLPHLEAISHNV